jgi:hypothetical protein
MGEFSMEFDLPSSSIKLERISDLPIEILLIIFRLTLQAGDGPTYPAKHYRVLADIRRVSRQWNADICHTEDFWTILSGKMPESIRLLVISRSGGLPLSVVLSHIRTPSAVAFFRLLKQQMYRLQTAYLFVFVSPYDKEANSLFTEVSSFLKTPAPILETFSLRWKIIPNGALSLLLDDLFMGVAPHLTSFSIDASLSHWHNAGALNNGRLKALHLRCPVSRYSWAPLTDFLPSLLQCSPELESLVVKGFCMPENWNLPEGKTVVQLQNLRCLAIQANEDYFGGTPVQYICSSSCLQYRIEYSEPPSDSLCQRTAKYLNETLKYLKSSHEAVNLILLPNYQVVVGQYLFQYSMRRSGDSRSSWALFERNIEYISEDTLRRITRVSVSSVVWRDEGSSLIALFRRRFVGLETIHIERGPETLDFSPLSGCLKDWGAYHFACALLKHLIISGEPIVEDDMENLLLALKQRREGANLLGDDQLARRVIMSLALPPQIFPEKLLASFKVQCAEQQLEVNRMDEEGIFAAATNVAREGDHYDLYDQKE